MADETEELSGIEAAAARDEELAPQLWMMITTFWNSPGRNTLVLLGAAICAVVALTAFGQIKLNELDLPIRLFYQMSCAPMGVPSIDVGVLSALTALLREVATGPESSNVRLSVAARVSHDHNRGDNTGRIA